MLLCPDTQAELINHRSIRMQQCGRRGTMSRFAAVEDGTQQVGKFVKPLRELQKVRHSF